MKHIMSLSVEYIRTSLQNLYGDQVTGADIRAWCAMNSTTYPTVSKKLEQYKVGRGKWDLTVKEQLEQSYEAPAAEPAFETNLIPEKSDTFVRFGNFSDIKKIIQSRMFYPTFITGLSGNGKTFCVEQACAQSDRELIRVNITIETDEDDLIGGSALLMAKPSGTMDQSLKHLNEVPYYCSMKSTLQVTKSSAFSQSLKEKEFFSRKLAESLKPRRVSKYSPPQILREKDPTMDDSSVLTCSTKPF